MDSPQPILVELRWVAICISTPVAISYVLTWLVWITKNKLLKIIVLTFVILLMFVNLFLFYNFYTLLSPWILLLIEETNINESSEFISQYAFSTGTIISLFITLLVIISVLFCSKHNMILRRKWQKVFFALSLICVLPVGVYMLAKTIQLPFLRTQLAIEEWYEKRGAASSAEDDCGLRGWKNRLHRYKVIIEICPEHDRLSGAGPETPRSGDRSLL